ncbi:MAG: hypothetical protein GWN99_02900 [Gemmatimonadetes bacterium]|uniref:Uncharacterized protein n=1 Tax=Candidatus Kutchimonas denitrificans TaxID=3056748 RepID=A0AAE4Z702_9BACT|nr:hypothetical protein [Gemmatimonadota bacterium]NIR74904.1 hypothetical protein [Candidatus Kutchimonas denitrificans]NIS00016.1 hypothetical protein [Gemmatimonadota bacterium]NIT65599.1 hypothetical protein [Gemmatimonadota bacterium]NIU52569.1 hypothetical protein [Gemmatimonadota bacterium]
MDLLNRAELRELIDERDVPSISLYLPTHRTGVETKQDPIRFKNVLRQAGERLVDSGLRSSEAEELLAPAHSLLDDDDFWQHQGDGLAVFISTETFRHYRLPYEFNELVVLTDRFHIKPLLSLFTVDGRFYVLALSQNEVRLLQGTHHRVGPVNLDSLPKSLRDALGAEEREKQLQFHTANRAGGAIFHGHGGGGADESVHKKALLRYFKVIDNGLQELLADESAPLVLAGVDYLLPIYREANSYAKVMEEGIVGNPEPLSDQELHDRAWSILEPHFARKLERAAAQFHELLGTGRATDELDAIVPAAHNGRIASLFVAVGVQRWGTYDPSGQDLMVHDEPEPGDQDLLDLAAVQTLAHGGDVFAVKPDEIPDGGSGGSLAAIFRY